MMIQCEECGANISDRASACPYCGCPVSEMDDYDSGYQTESGAIQARQDNYNAIQAKNKKARKQWRLWILIMSPSALFLMYCLGTVLYGSWLGVLVMFLCYLVTVLVSGISFWKGLLLHLAIPKLLGYLIIALCGCVGYTLGFLSKILS